MIKETTMVGKKLKIDQFFLTQVSRLLLHPFSQSCMIIDNILIYIYNIILTLYQILI